MPDDSAITRRGLLRGAGLAGAAALSGCAGAVPGFETDEPAAGGDGTVTGWAWDGGAAALEGTLDRYPRQGDGGREVVIETVDHGAMTERFRPALADGSGAPAFALLESVVAPEFVNTGGLADLSDRLGSAGREAFVDGAWDAISDDGAIYAVPWDVAPVGMYYRRDVYAEHGIDPGSIETWSDFVAAGETLPSGGGQFSGGISMINLPPNDLDGFWRRGFRQLGGRPFTEEGAVNVHGETSLRVARVIDRIAEADIAENLESWGSNWFDALREGRIASLPAGPWMAGILEAEMEDTAGDWGVYPLPAYEPAGNHATNWGGSNLCLPEQTPTEVADHAWDYVEWVTTTPAVQNAIYREYGIFPSLEAAYDADLYDEELSFFDGQAIRRVFADLAPDVPGYEYDLATPAVSAAMNDFLGQMVTEELSPREAVRSAAEQVADQTGKQLS